jgi:hypothetical protein
MLKITLTLTLFAILAQVADAGECEVGQAPTTSGETITCSAPRANTEVWRIERPNIGRRLTTYPGIRFRKGDLVSVFAGGCAQHGGSGLTWKRYVNPMSPEKNDADRYHGLIGIPGYPGLRPLRDAVLQGGTPVLGDPGEENQLTLGYVDDDDGYGDNGYWNHDDGWWQQCNDLPDAWIVLAIQHDCAASAEPACVHGRALDLVVDKTDGNGFPENPDWVYTRLTGTPPDPVDVCGWSTRIGGFPVDDASLCASTVTRHDGSGACTQAGTPGGLAGHMNWADRPVAYSGWIWWEGHDYYYDDDYTLNMAALNASKQATGSLFVNGQFNPQVEFDSSETIDQFDGVRFWNDFHHAVDNEDQRLHTANATVAGAKSPSDFFPGGTEAIVIGQLGLDCGHSCGTELHPAWAFFLHVKNDPKDDVWAFFMRNWGNEGFCSTNEHKPASAREFTVRLPRLWAGGVELTAETRVGMNYPGSPYSLQMAAGGDGADFGVTLPPADDHGIVFGELHLKWKLRLPNSAIEILSQQNSNRDDFLRQREAEIANAQHDDVEEQLTERLSKLPELGAELRSVLRSSRPGTSPKAIHWVDVGSKPAIVPGISSVPVPGAEEKQARQMRLNRRLPKDRRNQDQGGAKLR